MAGKTVPKKSVRTRPRVIYYFASSADGFVADAQGGVAWLDAYDGDYGFTSFIKGIDGVVMGRKTYQQALTFGTWGFKKTIPCVVLSRTLSEGPHIRKFWSGPVAGILDYLREQGASNIWMVGGGAAAAAFLDAGLIDEIEQHVIPIVLGSGIPAFGPLGNNVPLQLTESKTYKNGVVMVRYRPAMSPAKRRSPQAQKTRKD